LIMQHEHAPGTPPATEVAWYTLAYAKLGARAVLRLLEAFQQPAAILAATPRDWAARARLTADASTRLLAAINVDHTSALARLRQLGIRLLPILDPAYPPRLRAIADPPYVLFVNGELPPAEQPAIAIVGARRASPYGRHVAAELAAGLAQRGIVVISGMALGTDAAAHEGCLRGGGRTIAVLGSGVDVIYPPENTSLYQRIVAQGAVISEAPLGSPPTPKCFPIRNRIISGLALGVVIVEAAEKSGALITAEHALEQGREVFAVPGSVNSPASRGTHRLLREGAKLVESVEDILEELPIAAPPVRCAAAPLHGPSWDLTASAEEMPNEQTPAPLPARRAPLAAPAAPAMAVTLPALPPEEDTIVRLLSSTAKHIDDLIVESTFSPAQVNAALLMLELKGFVQRRPGNQYVRLR
jgi:DNA processing protein